MPRSKIEEFGKVLVQIVRDAAIKSSDRRRVAGAKHVIGKRWKEVLEEGDPNKICQVLIPDIVDDTIFHMLRAIDEELLPLSFVDPDGTSVNLPAEGNGELAGWYMGREGWRSVYSQERVPDDFPGLK
jgi:hypothetical protein